MVTLPFEYAPVPKATETCGSDVVTVADTLLVLVETVIA